MMEMAVTAFHTLCDRRDDGIYVRTLKDQGQVRSRGRG